MSKLLEAEEKKEFILKNGWEIYMVGINGAEFFIPENAVCEGGMCFNYSLDKAYELEMEREYDRLITMLKEASYLVGNFGPKVEDATQKDCDEWQTKYKEWCEK